jgi:hypothetical protein
VISQCQWAAKTEPLIFRISKLERENNKLIANLDSLEQYGRRSLIRVAGISEGGSDEDTNTIIQKIFSSDKDKCGITEDCSISLFTLTSTNCILDRDFTGN